MRKVVTTYINPDMDGISLMYAYTEFLRKHGENAEYYFEGKAKKEVGIVLKKFGIMLNNINKVENEDRFIIVDTNKIDELPEKVNEENIIEIIDHHKAQDWIDKYNNIKFQIEPIGAAATIVAERFKNGNIDISRESAILLYYGIISNTMNLKIDLTSTRDVEMANWLREKVPEITDEITKNIFIEKSNIENNLREEMEVEFKDDFMPISWSMGQLEIANVDEFLEKNELRIREILKTVSIEKKVDYLSVNCMDVLNGYSVIIASNEQTAQLITKNTGYEFNNLKSRINKLVSRKEIVKIIRDSYK